MTVWEVRDGDKPGQGEKVGLVQSFQTGLIEVKVDGYFTPAAAERLRLQLSAAINEFSPRRDR